MPYQTRKVRGKNCYKVFKNINKKTKKGTLRKTQRVFAKCATAENAKKQMNLLRAIENNKKFVPYSSRKPVVLNKTKKFVVFDLPHIK